MVLIHFDIFTFPILLRVSYYIGMCILVLALCRKNFLHTQKAKLLYAISIIIVIRSLLIINIYVLMENMPQYFKTMTYLQNYMQFGSVDSWIRSMNRQNYLGLLQSIWLFGAVSIAIYYLIKYMAFHKTLHRLKIKLDDPLIYAALEKQKEILHIKKAPKIYLVNGLGSPMLVGLYRPKIILPRLDYNKSELQYIFRHELIHFKRKDNIIKLLVTIATIIHWFQPLIYVLKKLCHDFCELSCDESVTCTLDHNEIQKYSLLLLKTVRHTNELALSPGVSYFNKNSTKYRIERMFTTVKNKDRTILMCIIISTLMLATMFYSSWMAFVTRL